ncbi:MAG: DUF1211 domain-containing protein [Ignavibacteria bacterium]|nr:DUF1211 domain-containing protein [Ignavibacteria bacterium]MBK8383873.1 DUF1211 domain-containing protein [Ignavibacteria bacterium]MBL0108431.1 DUF1211 domain-containing protein [Ignavibacteria bacterium]
MPDYNDESLLPKNRIEALSDGIFAIAMTLIILDLKTPENIPLNLEYEELPLTLLNILPDVEAYAVSFLVLAVFWLRHQLQFRYLKFANRKIIVLSILFLMLIGFVPFSVGLVMRYNDIQLPTLIYIINLLLISVILSIQGWYISKNKKIRFEEIEPEILKKYYVFSIVPIVIFSVSLIVSFFNLRLAFLLIYLDPAFYSIYRIVKKRTSAVRYKLKN